MEDCISVMHLSAVVHAWHLLSAVSPHLTNNAHQQCGAYYKVMTNADANERGQWYSMDKSPI